MARVLTAAESAVLRRLSEQELLREVHALDEAYRRAIESDDESEGGAARRLVRAARTVLSVATGPASAFADLQSAVEAMNEWFEDGDADQRRAALDDKGRP